MCRSVGNPGRRLPRIDFGDTELNLTRRAKQGHYGMVAPVRGTGASPRPRGAQAGGVEEAGVGGEGVTDEAEVERAAGHGPTLGRVSKIVGERCNPRRRRRVMKGHDGTDQ